MSDPVPNSDNGSSNVSGARFGAGFDNGSDARSKTWKKKYTVSKFRKVETKYGHRIVVELENQYAVFLPSRIMKVFKDA